MIFNGGTFSSVIIATVISSIPSIDLRFSDKFDSSFKLVNLAFTAMSKFAAWTSIISPISGYRSNFSMMSFFWDVAFSRNYFCWVYEDECADWSVRFFIIN